MEKPSVIRLLTIAGLLSLQAIVAGVGASENESGASSFAYSFAGTGATVDPDDEDLEEVISPVPHLENHEKHKCGKNEEYVDCVATHCLIKDCTDLGFPIKCEDKLEDGSCPGKPGCVCVPGYARDGKGKCIKTDQCPSCGGDKNAKPGCGINCGKKCTDVGKQGPFNCPSGCRYNGCDCKDGYYYDAKKKLCVKPKECVVCKKNEQYEDCVDTYCLIKDCKELGFPIKCKAKNADGSCPGKPGCVCSPGYARNNKGICIKVDQCASCGGDKNAKPGCGVNCGKKCSDVGKQGPFKCPRLCKYNGCDCKDGYYYDAKKKLCVKPKECFVCKKNEQYVDCVDTYCLIKDCKELGFPIKCKAKNADGSCPGKPGCVCSPGYARNNKGICIKVDQCPSCGGDKNAKPGCGINCGKKCSDVGKQGPFKCTIGCTYNGCDCKDGYYYDAKKKLCVKPEECIVCKKNEQYVDCVDTYCLIKDCKQLGFPIKCKAKKADGSCPGKPGCVCSPGYARNKKGICIKVDKCPSCGGDRNAQLGCGTNCGKKCSDIGNTEPIICPLGCAYNACNCRDGYYYDEEQKKCVKPSQCSTDDY